MASSSFRWTIFLNRLTITVRPVRIEVSWSRPLGVIGRKPHLLFEWERSPQCARFGSSQYTFFGLEPSLVAQHIRCIFISKAPSTLFSVLGEEQEQLFAV